MIFFVSPQLWAWKKGRIKRVRRFVDRMLVIFPFEEPFLPGARGGCYVCWASASRSGAAFDFTREVC